MKREATETTPLCVSNSSTIPQKNDNDVTDNGVHRHLDLNHAHNSNKRHHKDINPEPAGHGKKAEFKFFSTLSSRKKYTLILLTVANFLAGCAFSLLGPFFATEASKKGMDQTVIGLVFGVFEVMIFITSPLFGNYLTKIGPRFVFIAGIFIGSSCNILFGTLYMCPSGTPFMVMTILVRSVEAIGFSGYITASFAIVSNEFKENIGFAFGILETGSGLGFMIGPTIGGALYAIGGFGAPFYFAGCAVMLNGLLAWKYLPPVEDVTKKRKGSMLGLLRSPMVVIPMFSVFAGVIGITTFDSTLAKHLEPLNLSVGLIGVIFGVVAFVYSIMSSIWGYISDTLDIQSPLIIMGHFFFGLGFLIVGPAVFFTFIPFTLPSLIIGLVFIGFSLGCALIPTMKCMVTGAIELGFENNIDTYALVSGLFNCIHTIAGFIGPVGIGALVQAYGFPVAYTVVGMCSIIMMFVALIYFTIRKIRAKRGPYEEIKSSRTVSVSEDVRSEFFKSESSSRRISIAFNRSVSVPIGSLDSFEA